MPFSAEHADSITAKLWGSSIKSADELIEDLSF